MADDNGNGRYSTRAFMIPARDAKGFSERAFCRMPPTYVRVIDEIMARRIFPYRCKGDLIRHAIVRHLDWLNSLQPLPSVRGQVDALVEILRDEQYQQDFGALFETMTRVIQGHLGAQALGQARRLVTLAKMRIEAMPEEYWREHYLGELKERFGHLLNGEGVRLKGIQEEEDDSEWDPEEGETD